MLLAPIVLTVLTAVAFLFWVQPRELRPLAKAKPLAAFEPRHEWSALLVRNFLRAQRLAAVVGISMLSAFVAVDLTSTQETNLGHWVADNVDLLVIMLCFLWFVLVIEASVSLWRLARSDPESFNKRSLTEVVGAGFFVAFFSLLAMWSWYNVAIGHAGPL